MGVSPIGVIVNCKFFKYYIIHGLRLCLIFKMKCTWKIECVLACVGVRGNDHDWCVRNEE